MSKNTLIEAMRVPRSISQDGIKVWTVKQPVATENHVPRAGERGVGTDGQVGLQAAFGLGAQPPPRR